MPDVRILRYFPGSRPCAIGLKVPNATPIVRYIRGNPKFGCAIVNPKNAKETLNVSNCNGTKTSNTGFFCTPLDGGNANAIPSSFYDGGNANSNFANILNSGNFCQ